VAHLDLKLENVLLTEEFRIKLCDLGFSQSTEDRVFQSVGTDGYKAPEIYKFAEGTFEDEETGRGEKTSDEPLNLG
jgi:serine/threonine protein kinase